MGSAIHRLSVVCLIVGLALAGAASAASAGEVEDFIEQALRERKQAPPADAAEMAQAWDAFLTAVVKRAGADARQNSVRGQLLAILLDQRIELVERLSEVSLTAPELVDGLFDDAWGPLSELLGAIARDLPEDRASRYRAFLEAGGLLYKAERFALVQQFSASPSNLRRLTRLLLPDASGDPLVYDVAVDPELRQIFGFGPPLPPPAPSPLLAPLSPPTGAAEGLPLAARTAPSARSVLSRVAGALGDLLVTPAWASAVPTDSDALAARLNTWIPQRREMRQYVPLVRDMLTHTARESAARTEVDAEWRPVFRDLVVATAWQESCWRQYVLRDGKVEPLLSPVGSIGLMQINPRVWRGIYEMDGLNNDIGYNGRAGAEILSHYLQDVALPSGEHRQPGGADSLARATYSAYNGGPRHIQRYRNEETSQGLKKIDEEFWKKYQVVKAGKDLSRVACHLTRD